MNRGSSTRLMLAPSMSCAGASIVIVVPPFALRADRRAGPDRLRRVTDRRDDVLVAGAAAEIAFDGVADLVVGGIRVLRQQVDGGHDHAGRAEPALETVLLPERGLHRVELIAVSEALDRLDLRPVRLDGEHGARLDRPAVDMDGAGAALAGVAADMRPGQVEVLPQRLDEESPGLDIELPWRPIDDERDMFAHGHEPPAARAVTKPNPVVSGVLRTFTAVDPPTVGRPLMVAPRRLGIKSTRRRGPGRATGVVRRVRAPRSGC